MDRKVCAFTGHRHLPRCGLPTISQILREVILSQAASGTTVFTCGGALGFDTLAALAVLDASKTFPEIELALVLPCKDQDRRWSAQDRSTYREIKDRAANIVTLHNEYVHGCMHERNRYLVDRASIIIAYLNRASGGTFYTVKYAERLGIPVINIASAQYPCSNPAFPSQG